MAIRWQEFTIHSASNSRVADSTVQVDKLTEERPWGFFEVLGEKSNHKVKYIYVKPNQKLSYQNHTQRAEHWFIVSGLAEVTIDDYTFDVGTGDTIDIEIGQKHRIAALDNPVEFIEVQTGSYFGEDDIVRYEDDYDRA